MSPLSQDEKTYYAETLDEAREIVFTLGWSIDDTKATYIALQPLIAAVYASIVQHIHYRRQLMETNEVRDAILATRGKKPSRIFGAEKTGWKPRKGPYGSFESAVEGEVHEKLHQDILWDLSQKVHDGEQSPKRVEGNYEYWASLYEKTGKWYLNRKERKQK